MHQLGQDWLLWSVSCMTNTTQRRLLVLNTFGCAADTGDLPSCSASANSSMPCTCQCCEPALCLLWLLCKHYNGTVMTAGQSPTSSSMPCTCQCREAVLYAQTVQTFEAALEALVAAGVELVEFDMGLLTAEGAEIEAELLLAYEMPREVSRSARFHSVTCCILSSGAWS